MRCSILWEKNWTIILCFKSEFEFIADNEIHSPDDIQIDTTNETKQHSLLMFRTLLVMRYILLWQIALDTVVFPENAI